MKTYALVIFGLALGWTWVAPNTPWRASCRRYEALAAQLRYFPTDDFLYDRPFNDHWNPMPKKWDQAWEAVYREFENLQTPVADLIGLTRHSSPKVRTLAMGALYHREDFHLLPYIAAAGSKDKTFGMPRRILGGLFHPRIQDEPPEILDQTVAEIATKFLRSWLNSSGNSWQSMEVYWEARKDRAFCASWFQFRLQRALQGIRPINENRLGLVKLVRRDVDKLPPPDRDWTLLWVGANWLNHEIHYHFASKDDLLQAGQRLGPQRLLKELRGEKVSDDPDLMPTRGPSDITVFVLRHAVHLLRPGDAPTLLEGEKRWYSPMWAIAAAELRPESAEGVLRSAMTRFRGLYDEQYRAWLAEALWRLGGLPQLDYLVEWFYQEQPKTGGSNDAKPWFVKALKNSQEGRKFFAAILADKRFEAVEGITVVPMAEIINHWSGRNLWDPKSLRGLGHFFWINDYHLRPQEIEKGYPQQTADALRQLADLRWQLQASVHEWNK